MNHIKEINKDELIDKLKRMKLSGMVEAFRLQLDDPNADLRSFLERFEDLCNAEWTLRYDKKFNRYLKKAHLKFPGACFDESIYDP